MGFMLFPKQDKILETLRQIKEAILLLQEWNREVSNADDYLLSANGMKNLAASCMLIESIGEGFKKIDKDSNSQLLSLWPSIPWKAVMGMRNQIAHGYFNIDAEIVFDTVKNDLEPLLQATLFFISKLSTN